MNLKQGSTDEQLAELLASVNDARDSHIVYVTKEGDVLIEPLPMSLTPAQWAEKNDEKIQFRLETFAAGNGYVGDEAALDKKHVSRLHDILIEKWEAGEIGYIDDFYL